jgi:hypothetical protein
MPRARAIALLAALAVTGLLAGCGGSSDKSSRVSAQSYVASLCGAVIPFERAVVSRSALLGNASPTDPAKSKRALQSFFAAVSGDAGTAATRVRRAGTPDVQNGKRISGAINAAFTQLQGAMRQAATRSDALPAGNQAAFRSAATTLFNNFRTSMSQIGQSLQAGTLRSAPLQRAASRTQACKALSSGA